MRLVTLTLALLLAGPAWAKPKKPAAAWEPPNELVEEYNHAITALNAGNPTQAAGFAARVVDRAPDCGMALVLLAEARTRMNEPTKALPFVQHAVELFPDKAVAHASLAEAAFAAQQFPLAEAEASKALELEPTQVRYVAFAVQASIRLGHDEQAKAHLARAQIAEADRACLDANILLETRQLDAAKARMAACDATAAPELREAAEAAFVLETGDHDKIKDAVGTLGLTGYELVLRGEELGNAGRYEEAVPVLQAARVAVPHELSVLVNLGIALEALGRYPEAEGALTEALAGTTWVDVHATGNISGITTKRSEENLLDLQRQAAAILVRVQAKNAKAGAASKTLANARERFGDVVELVVAEAQLREAEGKPVEAWSLLRAVVARGGQGDRGVARAIGQLAVTHPEGLDAATAAYVRAHGDTVDRLNLAFGENNGKDYTGCLDDVEAVLAKDPVAKRAAEAGYACAVLAGLPDRAAPMLARLDGNVDPGLLHDHALALQEQGRHADVLALLAKHPAEGEFEPRLRSLAIRSHVAQKSWAEVTALATKPGLEPRFAAWVGQELLLAERKNDAARVLGGVCPKLSGEDGKTCRQLLERAAAK